ncbi:MAG: cyclic nucleotide-binding domain-containing protein [Acetobacteraceae bacterium]|nr:cyclic nucleotide-binding domain-containing protein [Acetobacteraceae bacterium]
MAPVLVASRNSEAVSEAGSRQTHWCNDLTEIRRLPLVRDIAPARVNPLLREAALRDFAANATVVHEGRRPEFLHIVVEGSLEVFASHRGRERSLVVVGPGQSFVVSAVLLDRPYLKAVRALEPSRILMIPAGAVRTAFADDGGVARALARDLALSYRNMVKELKNQALRSGLERLANWLLAQDAKTGGTGRFDLPFEKRALAARLGMVPEALSRGFAALAAHGATVRGASVTLHDPEALARLAQPCPTIDDHDF